MANTRTRKRKQVNFLVSYQDWNKDVKQIRIDATSVDDAYTKVWGGEDVAKIIAIYPCP